MGEEKVFLDEGGVRVTSARCIQGSKTFALSGITSVRLASVQPRRGLPLLALVGGVLIALGAFTGPEPATGATIGGLLAIGGFLILRGAKVRYQVMFAAASGEVAGVETTDRGQADRVLAAINEAIVHRG